MSQGQECTESKERKHLTDQMKIISVKSHKESSKIKNIKCL
jgi:hypothetical protein